MNVQTEKLERHIARLTVAVEAAKFEKSKKQAARKLARRVNIPGFRKGKAPYGVLVSYVGEAPIVEEAIETLGNEVYKVALDESKIEPYTMGELENFTLDPEPTFVFTVPMQPTVELNDYTSVRVDFEPPEMQDSDVDEALRRLQEEHAVVEDSASAVALGDRVTIDVSGNYVVDDDGHDHDHEDDHDHDEDDPHDHSAPIHQHDAQIVLEAEREPLPGFSDALVGAEVDETRQFELTYPEDDDKYGEFAGKAVNFTVTVKKIENITLPALNDEFAARVSEEDDEIDAEEPLTLLELRGRLRENIAKQIEEGYNNEYMELVMDELVEIADFAYPDAMLENQIDSMIEQSAQQFRVSVDDFLRLTQQEREDIYEDENYQSAARRYIERSLVMRGILDVENLEVADVEVEAEIDRFMVQFGDQADTYRGLFDTPEMRSNMTNSLLEQKIRERIVAIGQGQESTSDATEDESAGAASESVSDETAAVDEDEQTETPE